MSGLKIVPSGNSACPHRRRHSEWEQIYYPGAVRLMEEYYFTSYDAGGNEVAADDD